MVKEFAQDEDDVLNDISNLTCDKYDIPIFLNTVKRLKARAIVDSREVNKLILDKIPYNLC